MGSRSGLTSPPLAWLRLPLSVLPSRSLTQTCSHFPADNPVCSLPPARPSALLSQGPCCRPRRSCRLSVLESLPHLPAFSTCPLDTHAHTRMHTRTHTCTESATRSPRHLFLVPGRLAGLCQDPEPIGQSPPRSESLCGMLPGCRGTSRLCCWAALVWTVDPPSPSCGSAGEIPLSHCFLGGRAPVTQPGPAAS